MKIELFGAKTSSYQLMHDRLKLILAKANIEYAIEEINDVDQFIKNDIMSVPAIRVDKKDVFYIGKNGSFNKNLRTASNFILAKENYGSLKKFLLPIDFSDVSINAMLYGNRLATDLDAVTYIFHAFMPKISTLQPEDFNENLVELDKEKLDDCVKELDKDWNGDVLKAPYVNGIYKVGFPSDLISSSIKEKDISMVIMGTRGQSEGLLNKLFGTVSLDLLDSAGVPVLAVPKECKYSKIKNILVACDSDNIPKEMDFTKSFSNELGAKLHFVHVNTYGEEGKKQCQNEDVVRIDNNSITSGIVEYANTHNVDLLVVNRKKKSTLEKILTPHVKSELLSLSKIPILAVG